MSGVTYDPFKVYNIGDPELSQRTDVTSLTGQVQDYAKLKAQYAGSTGFNDPEFPHDNRSIGKIGVDSANTKANTDYPIIWLRPQDALRNYLVQNANNEIMYPQQNYVPKFCTTSCGEKLSRFDVIQGSIGNCFFVASLAAVSTIDKYMKVFVPSDNQDDQGSGVYHYRFWTQGVFVDVVVDDYLPFMVLNERRKQIIPYGANLKPVGLDVEFWVQLAEKAYAKLMGGYGNVASGGFAINSLQELTGGMSEAYSFKERNYPADLFEKLKGVLEKEAVLVGVSCRTNYGTNSRGENNPDPEKDAVNLKYNHAYTVTKADSVQRSSGYRTVTVKLLRIRNPHGTNEFTGPWSDGSQVWDDVSESEKARIGVEEKDDGEFWMAFTDAVKYFDDIQIISPIDQEKFSKPPSNYVAYDGVFGGEEDSYVIQASSPDLNPNGEAVIIADLTYKSKTRLTKFMQLNLFSNVEPVQDEYPAHWESMVQQYKRQYQGQEFSLTDPSTGRVITFNKKSSAIPQIEGVKDVQNYQGTSVAAAWKVPPGEYKIIASCPDNYAPYTLRVLYFKSG